MMGGATLTASQLASHARSKAFRAHIDTLAQKLKAETEAPVPKIFVEAMAEPTPISDQMFWFHPVVEIGEPLPAFLRPTIQKIQQAACFYFNARRSDMLSPRRPGDIVRARQIAMFISKDLTAASLPQVGRRFGGRDHTTVLHAVRKINRLLPLDLGIAFDVAAITYSLIGDQPQ